MNTIKSLSFLKQNRSKGIYIFIGFLFIFMLGFASYSFTGEGSVPIEMKIYFGVHLLVFLYIILYIRDKRKTDTFLGKKDNGVVLWDILKYSFMNIFYPIKKLLNKNKKQKLTTNKELGEMK